MTPVERVEADIRDRLAGMATDDPLPSVRELAAEHQTSPATVHKAVKRLVGAGLVVTRQGWGAFKA